jgi:hypothetical protein
MYASTTYSGGISRGDMTLHVQAGSTNTCTATITATGGTGFCPEVWGWGADNHSWGGAQSCTSTTLAVGGGTHPGGTYTFVVFKGSLSTTDNAGTYSLSVTGPGCTNAYDAKADTVCASDSATQSKLANALSGAMKPQMSMANNGTQGSSTPVELAGNTGKDWVAAPIDVATGNMCETVTDYTTAGQNPLALTRIYHSLSYTRGLYPTLIGVNWRTNYDRYLRIVNFTQVAAERPDGQVINFRCNVSTKSCVPDSDEDYTLTYSGSHAATWKLTGPDDTVETYTNTSGKGSLSSIAWRNGYTQTMNYTTGQLTSVSDSYSRSLSFTYTGSVVTGVTTPDSATLTYPRQAKACSPPFPTTPAPRRKSPTFTRTPSFPLC